MTSPGFIVFFINILFITACNQSANTVSLSQKDTVKPGEMRVMIPESACYAGSNGKDSFFLKMEVFPNVVTGKLAYNFAEKDRSTGEIEGVLKGDTLLADYTFTAEGTLSTRPVAFLIKNASVIEGYGPVEEKAGKTIFVKPGNLNFSGPPLAKIPCGEK